MRVREVMNHPSVPLPLPANDPPFRTAALELVLRIDDPQVINSLETFPSTELRDRHAVTALRIGLLALEQARGRLDVDRLHNEAEHLLKSLATRLDQHVALVTDRVADTMKGYFDPQSGRFEERMRGLLGRDGELQRALDAAIGGDQSQLARTLVAHVGQESALMRRLDPEASEGLVTSLGASIEDTLRSEREAVLHEFSLDNSEGALRRLLRELETRHGNLEESMAKRLADVVGEFSLDDDDSALSRLVAKVESTQRTIANELTLDNEASALARMAAMMRDTQKAVNGQLTLDDEKSPMSKLLRHITDAMKAQNEVQAKFQDEVTQAVTSLTVRRDADARSTEHGRVFEDVVVAEVRKRAQRAGDACDATGARVGRIKHSKKGDAVVELGPDCAAAGARIVIEAKEDRSYGLIEAREEIELARKNRDAAVGIFVFSRATAPEGMEAFTRFGQDVVVVWNADDPGTDVVLDAALSVGKALCVREASKSALAKADVAALEASILEVERRVQNLEQVKTWASTIEGNAKKIIGRLNADAEALAEQIGILQDVAANLRGRVE